MRRSFRSRVLPVPPAEPGRAASRGRGVVHRAPEHVEQAAILRAVFPAHAGVESLGTSALQVGHTADPETPEIGGDAGADAGDLLQLIPRGPPARLHRRSISGSTRANSASAVPPAVRSVPLRRVTSLRRP